jgi:glycine cleavage system H protein
MEFPADLRYSNEHEWLRIDGDEAVVGISDFAQDSLGDVVYIALPEVGALLSAGEQCGEIESTKSVSELYAPVSGTVVAVNDALADRPELVNQDPYGEGWMLRLTLRDESECARLLDAGSYRALVEG